jgi:predicted nucleic acid-binding protein
LIVSQPPWQEVLSRIAAAVVPEAVIEAARSELRKRTQAPEIARAGKQRARLMTRLEQLKKQHGWGDISDDQYRSERDATQAALARLPDGDRVVAFDAHRARILALPDAIAVATAQRREELCRIVVERVVVADRRVVEIEWTAPTQSFLERQREYPQGGSSTRPLSDDETDDVLAWYVA